MDGWMDGWMVDGWVDGWMDGEAGLKIAYSNQQKLLDLTWTSIWVFNI